MNFAEVILPFPLKGTFTYSVPQELQDQLYPGTRVLVQFGPKKVYTGIVMSLHNQKPVGYQAKEILDCIHPEPVVTQLQLSFFSWLSEYYMSTLGEVTDAAIPAGLKISSESYISFNPLMDVDSLEVSDREWELLELLRNGELKIDLAAKSMGLKSIYTQVKSLSQKKAITLFEQVKDNFLPKKEKRVRLDPGYLAELSLEQLTLELEKKPLQLEVLISYLKQSEILEYPERNERGIAKSWMIKNGSGASSLKTLIKKGVLHEWEETVSRFDFEAGAILKVPSLSEAQQKAKSQIIEFFQTKDTVLLKGITGSGKTEVYISLIQEVLHAGGQVLYLLPEIALTTQIIKRLSLFFGDTFGVYHSKYSENERVEIWQKVLRKKLDFVVGVRSAVFLPFSSLSLIIVDEEHEPSYKQYDPSPRYHARDAAIYLATLHQSHVLLGSATPAVETYKNALDGKYGLVTLDQRFGIANEPIISLVDVVREKKKKKIRGNFTSELLTEIEKTIAAEEQVILFQNRRGYSPFLQCLHCGYIAKCPNCDVSLTYHIHQNLLICHYCGHKNGMLSECPDCQSHELQTQGFGTEKLEEELQILLPNARITRMDLDSTRSKYSYQQIIDSFEEGEIDVLIGTQMVSKGLDFDKVRLVGIFDADRLIHFPDFRAHERAFQLMRQVSGRAGRRAKQGLVLIQTANTEQKILNYINRHDYEGFYWTEIKEREDFRYPPFFRMIQITLMDKDKNKVREAATFLYVNLIRDLSAHRIIGPVEPLIARIRNQYLMEMTLKIEKQGVNLSAVKEFLLNSRNILQSQRLFKSVRIIFDVDPI